MTENQTIALLYEALIHAEGSHLIKLTGIDVIALQAKLDAIVSQPIGKFDDELIAACHNIVEETKANY